MHRRKSPLSRKAIPRATAVSFVTNGSNLGNLFPLTLQTLTDNLRHVPGKVGAQRQCSSSFAHQFLPLLVIAPPAGEWNNQPCGNLWVGRVEFDHFFGQKVVTGAVSTDETTDGWRCRKSRSVSAPGWDWPSRNNGSPVRMLDPFQGSRQR